MMHQTESERTSSVPLPRRTKYTPGRRLDRWIVPLLAEAIATRIERCRPSQANTQRCLDVGCGGQPLRAQLTQAGFVYSSLDVQQNAAGTVDHMGVIDGALPTSLAGQQFDFIVCTEVLEHVADWSGAFKNLATLLKSGGRLLITCPHIWVPHEEPYDFFRPTSWALAHHAERVGLRALEIERLGDGYDVLGTVLAAVRLRAPRGRPWLWIVAGPVALLRKFILLLLSLRWMKGVIELRTGLYLDTVALLQKT
jgi:SAM-dependent methyltransferase